MAIARPPVFTSLDLGAALARSRSENKLLLVDATAPWCGPCRLMDRTTWVDERVVAWIEAHAIAFQLDVDAHGAAAKKLSVTAMPTVMVFRDGDEIDRVVGLQKPEALLAWLGDLARGVTSLDKKLAELALNPDDARLRLQYARMLVAAGRSDEARATIALRRDEIAPGVAPSLEDLRDWLVFNDFLGEAHRSLQWFDDCYASVVNRHDLCGLVEQVIGPLLLGAHRFGDARRLYGKQLWRIPVRDLVKTWKSARRRLRH